MQFLRTPDLFDLKFKVPAEKDNNQKVSFCSLKPDKYIDFIELSLKLLPDRQAYISRKKRIYPVSHRFTLS